MSPNQSQNNYPPSSQNGSQYYPAYYPSNVEQDNQARGHMNPTAGHYPDPSLSNDQQPLAPQPNTTQEPQQTIQPDYNSPSHPVLIPTPPPLQPGAWPRPNPPPLTNTPRAAVKTTSPPPLRYQCMECGNTFSRVHDRNRHYETTHSENPQVHQCEKCRKTFSRADAKKRHQDDGRCTNPS